MNDSWTISLEDGKYTLHYLGGMLTSDRYRSPWRDLTGDKLVLAMAHEILRLKEALAQTTQKNES